MKHLAARYKDYAILALKDRAYLVVDTTDAESIAELLPDGSSTSDDEPLNDICAVAIMGDADDTILRCAVARNNKSMDVYSIAIEDAISSKSSLSPSLSYRTPKRVSCFAFAQIPAASDADSPSSIVLVSGDVAGDSYAYNLVEKGQRLLLGHTASMLTDIAIVDDDDKKYPTLLLTSDRDEKIRISRFPDSHVLEGFLLGHTAYVTGFAVVRLSSSQQYVVSCGGDETLRLWDLKTKKQLCSISMTETRDGESTVNEEEESNNNNPKEIPTAIAASSCGRMVAVVFDSSKRLSLYKINALTTSFGDDLSLELMGSIACPSQPLSVGFHTGSPKEDTVMTVLLKDPEYIALYDIPSSSNKNNEAIAVPRGELRAMKVLRDEASEKKIAMPNTILEKDDFGNPVLQKENETRGPAGNDVPWNRVERVEKAKERGKRRKKRAKLAEAVESN